MKILTHLIKYLSDFCFFTNFTFSHSVYLGAISVSLINFKVYFVLI